MKVNTIRRLGEESERETATRRDFTNQNKRITKRTKSENVRLRRVFLRKNKKRIIKRK